MADPTKTSSTDANAAAGTTPPPATTNGGDAAPAAAATRSAPADARRAPARTAARQPSRPANGAQAAATDTTGPTSAGSFGHRPSGPTPMSPAPADETPPEDAPTADINSREDLEDEEEGDNRRQAITLHTPPPENPIQHPAYDVQKVYRTANQSVIQDEQGRWKIQFPREVDTSGIDANIKPSTTFATRELAYRAAAKLLKQSPSMVYRGNTGGAAGR